MTDYPKVYNLGHKWIERLFDGSVVVEEKIDGSQFSFGVKDGVLWLRSHHKEIVPTDIPSLFKNACLTAQMIKAHLPEGWTFRAESVEKPKHNHLAYARAPETGMVVFDIDKGEENYLIPTSKAAFCRELGLECVPTIHCGAGPTKEDLNAYLERDSILGGAKIEGVVIKNYSVFGDDKKVLMGKHVSDKYREIAKAGNPAKNADVMEGIAARFGTEARYAKAVQHLGESGVLTGELKDIGPLLKEVWDDVLVEAKDDIEACLWLHFQKQARSAILRGVPQYYKTLVAERQFAGKEPIPGV